MEEMNIILVVEKRNKSIFASLEICERIHVSVFSMTKKLYSFILLSVSFLLVLIFKYLEPRTRTHIDQLKAR